MEANPGTPQNVNSLLDDNDDDIQDTHRGRSSGRGTDREITLGTTMILGIFFALAVFGAVMFGFGYSIGGKHAAATSTSAENNPNATFNGFMKPNSGKTAAADPTKAPAGGSVIVPMTTPPPLPRAAGAKPAVTDEPVADAATPVPATVRPALTASTSLPRPTAAATPATPIAPPAPASALMVQIAAVSHQEDADLLVSTLKRRSYAVAIHHESQDQLLHVQVGPFANRKDADAMRQRLQADGFNAIVKGPAN